jgi:hypothetical protein
MIISGLTKSQEAIIRILLSAERASIRRRVNLLIATECDGLGFSLVSDCSLSERLNTVGSRTPDGIASFAGASGR